MIFDAPDLAHAAMHLLWFVARADDDRPEVIR
jgi:hypothetical protein